MISDLLNLLFPSVLDEYFVSNSNFKLRPVTQDELVEVIADIKEAIDSGWDDFLPQPIIKNNIRALLRPLIRIISLSTRTGAFPSAFKVAKVIPVFKSRSKSQPNNCRPSHF